MNKNIGIRKRICRFNLNCSAKINNSEERNFYHGHEYVDLGLPSGTLWATCNVGAESETDYGSYYMYGKGSKVYNILSAKYNGVEDKLASSADTARQVWGGKWRTPTREQMKELIKNTIYEWVTNYNDSGVKGALLTAQNGNSVFFPACGCWYKGSFYNVGIFGDYWSSSPYGSSDAYHLYLSSGFKWVDNDYRLCGFAVRGVFSRSQ